MSDDDYQAIYCRWAEQRYGIADVLKVDFDIEEGWPGTDVTPGDGWHCVVEISTAEATGHKFSPNPRHTREVPAHAMGEMMQSLVAAALRQPVERAK